MNSEEIEILCVLKEGDYDIHFTKKKNEERFVPVKAVGLASERFYMERRGDAKEIFRLGKKKKAIRRKEREGFIEINALQ